MVLQVMVKKKKMVKEFHNLNKTININTLLKMGFTIE